MEDTQNLLDKVPKLKDFISKEINLEVSYFGLIKIEPHTKIEMHIDYDNSCKLLLPLLNTESAKTVFYDTPIEETFIFEFDNYPGITNYIPYPYLEPKVIDEFILTHPAIFNAGITHGLQVLNHKKLPRYSLQLGFKHKDERKHNIKKW